MSFAFVLPLVAMVMYFPRTAGKMIWMILLHLIRAALSHRTKQRKMTPSLGCVWPVPKNHLVTSHRYAVENLHFEI